MADEAAYLVDMLLPESDYRQWTVTFPWSLRYQLAKDYKLITAVLRIVNRCLFSYQRKKAKALGYQGAKTAAVSFIHRAGRAINSHVHLHILMPDAVFIPSEKDTLDLLALPAPTDKEITELVKKIARKVTTFCEKHFATSGDQEDSLLEKATQEGMQTNPTLCFPHEDAAEDEPEDLGKQSKTNKRSAKADGFSLHANTSVKAKNRMGLEHLCRYGMRPPFSQERLTLSEDGQVIITLDKPWPKAGGITSLRFEPVEFMRRLSPLIPPPFAHLIRYHGLFAPRARGRDNLPAAPVAKEEIRPEAVLRMEGSSKPAAKEQNGEAEKETAKYSSPRPKRRVLSWAELLRRVFAIEILICPNCGGKMKLLAAVIEGAAIRKILTHLGMPTQEQPLAKARESKQAVLPWQHQETKSMQEQSVSAPWRRGKSRLSPPPEDDIGPDDNFEPFDTGEWGA